MRKLAAALAAVFLLPACLSGCAAPSAVPADAESVSSMTAASVPDAPSAAAPEDAQGAAPEAESAPGEESGASSAPAEAAPAATASSGDEIASSAAASSEAPQDEPETVRVTIPEGFTVLQICERLEANGICSGEAFFEVSQLYEPRSFTIPDDPDRAYKMEGYLFPATYEFEVGSDPTDVLIAMLNAYRANAGDLTDEELIVASIVERESRSAENAALVASVIYNRLEAGMPLQMDSTREYVNASVTDSPYLADTERFAALFNTYKCSGLPAGPICCPGTRAMNAARNPADTDYYYFFFGNDNENHYSATLEEHDAAMAEYGVQYG